MKKESTIRTDSSQQQSSQVSSSQLVCGSCGGVGHQRRNHSSCPLNPRNQDYPTASANQDNAEVDGSGLVNPSTTSSRSRNTPVPFHHKWLLVEDDLPIHLEFETTINENLGFDSAILDHCKNIRDRVASQAFACDKTPDTLCELDIFHMLMPHDLLKSWMKTSYSQMKTAKPGLDEMYPFEYYSTLACLIHHCASSSTKQDTLDCVQACILQGKY